jgi:hypothetical protein
MLKQKLFHGAPMFEQRTNETTRSILRMTSPERKITVSSSKWEDNTREQHRSEANGKNLPLVAPSFIIPPPRTGSQYDPNALFGGNGFGEGGETHLPCI